MNQEKDGGNGDVYVADGYGSNYVHRYSKTGEYISSINGEEGEAGRFATPPRGVGGHAKAREGAVHSRPDDFDNISAASPWIPAFAGMTDPCSWV